MIQEYRDAVVAAARRRALGERPWLRRCTALLWASFLGGGLSTVVLMLTPDSFTLPPDTVEGAACAFGVLWLLALIPAAIAAVLVIPPTNQGPNQAPNQSD
ncbi:MAG: hypothetical protein ISP90_15710 [Nevskia sp.]|nr:hypothetical protein [Nevskia sp.]